MPLFAALFGSVVSALTSFLAYFVGFRTALKLAAYLAWIALFGALLVSVFVCVTAILTSLTGMHASLNTGWISKFLMGLGMFIPSNAGAVLACCASVWISTNIYKVQKQGLFAFGS